MTTGAMSVTPEDAYRSLALARAGQHAVRTGDVVTLKDV
jgi:hypothetical protein